MIKLEFTKIEDLKALLGQEDSHTLNRIRNVGHFIQNVSEVGSREYEIGTYIIHNAEEFNDMRDWERLHEKFRTKRAKK